MFFNNQKTLRLCFAKNSDQNNFFWVLSKHVFILQKERRLGIVGAESGIVVAKKKYENIKKMRALKKKYDKICGQKKR